MISAAFFVLMEGICPVKVTAVLLNNPDTGCTTNVRVHLQTAPPRVHTLIGRYLIILCLIKCLL